MSRQRTASTNAAMLDLWRPPHDAGDPLGCLASTYTFAPGLFDEQCLARFLEIGSEPERENLAFQLERESRLGSVYAGVLVDHAQAGVEHSLRWDVLPVRLPAARQHAKLSLLAWSRHVRILVASANLTEPGYRTNHEVAAVVDLTPDEADAVLLADAVGFLHSLLLFVPGAAKRPPEVLRAEVFLEQVTRRVQAWNPPRRGGTLRRQLVFTLPSAGPSRPARSSLEEAVEACRARGGSPRKARIASPFFDVHDDAGRVAAALCKLMARGGGRELRVCVPAVRDDQAAGVPRLAAPKALLTTPRDYQADVDVALLPEQDDGKNRRPWHAKMLALRAEAYSALLIGSSNFTCAGLGVGPHRNAEANLLTIVERVSYGREVGQLAAVWPEMESVSDPDAAEWLGTRPDDGEDEQATSFPLPAGFLGATYRAGDARQIVLRLDPEHLPDEWRVCACGREGSELLSAAAWRERECLAVIEVPWDPVQPPGKLLVRWSDHEAFLSLNVEDRRALPPPPGLEHMSADDMLAILAAPDPSAAWSAWARQQQPSDSFDVDLDSATPIDLDPLRRHDLQATFLHRVRQRARSLARLRENLQLPASARPALEWRLRGPIGLAALADRLLRELAGADGAASDALLHLADFLIVLHEVDYQPGDASLSKAEFEGSFRPFLRELAGKLQQQSEAHRERVAGDVLQFWERVVDRCRQ